MRGLYLTYIEIDGDAVGGVAKKIRAQIDAISSYGIICQNYYLPTKEGLLYPVKWRLPWFNVSPIWKYTDQIQDADFLYMRRPLVINKYLIRFLQKAKEKKPSIKIIMEIPTYPYDQEYSGYKYCKLAKETDIVHRKKLRGNVDRLVTVTDDSQIFGIDTIRIHNGIDLSKIPIKKYIPEKDGEIHICAIAKFQYWHGYDRFLTGLHEYYRNGGTRQIICDFVGEGSEVQKYKDYVNENNLSKHVSFQGYLDGIGLQNIYDNATIALGSFGMYRKKLFYSCDLKSRESLGRGIPMVVGCPTEGFNDGYKYYLELPNDSSVIDIESIIKFHDKIYSDEPGEIVTRNIRTYAERIVDMRRCMKPVVDYLLS